MHSAVYLRTVDETSLGSGACRILLCGKSFIADQTGALYWPAEKTLVVSDLHLERGSYLADEGVVLPPYDTTSVFEKLEEALDRYDPSRVIALGDSFCTDSEARLSAHDADWLYDLIEDRDWYWISGPDQAPIPECFGGTVLPHVTLGGIKFRYEPVRAPVSHEIAGRMHPVAQISEYGHVMRGRCYVSNGMRLMLPSMGKYSAGANVLGSAFDSLLGHEGLFVWSINAGRVTQVASGQLLEEIAA
jgi:DNA ligase-associated metallophosphoesterase